MYLLLCRFLNDLKLSLVCRSGLIRGSVYAFWLLLLMHDNIIFLALFLKILIKVVFISLFSRDLTCIFHIIAFAFFGRPGGAALSEWLLKRVVIQVNLPLIIVVSILRVRRRGRMLFIWLTKELINI